MIHLMTIVWSLLHLALCFIAATVSIVATPRDSVLRLAAIPCLLLAANSLLHEWGSLSTSVVINIVFVGQGIFVLLQCINFMILTRLDSQHLQQAGIFTAQSSLSSKLLRTTSLLLNLRGIGTPWETKHVEALRGSVTAEENITAASAKHQRRNYLVRQTLIICWQYIFLDVVYQSSLENRRAPGSDPFPITFEFLYVGASAKQWAARSIVSLFTGLGPARIQIDIMYRLCGLAAVLTGVAEPKDWPPLFGRVTEAYSLRRFWT